MAGLHTRWHHLRDEELLDYQNQLPRTTSGVEVEPAMAEELFNRLELKIASDRKNKPV